MLKSITHVIAHFEALAKLNKYYIETNGVKLNITPINFTHNFIVVKCRYSYALNNHIVLES